MPDAWQSAWVEVLPDFANFRREANPQITSILGNAGDDGGRNGSKRFGDSFIGGVGKLALPIAGAFAALGIGSLIGDAVRTGIDYVSEGVGLASDLSESVNAVKVSYGDAAQAILDMGANSADQMAITRSDLNSFAVQFAGFSNTIAGPGGNVADVFSGITQRGVDFASVMNLDVSEALQLFQSGLAGETEPLRKYSIDLSAAAVENYALATGLATSAASMTEAQKVQARYGLIMQSTSQYAGDFANTSDGLANSQKRLNASMAEVQTSAGEIFLPLVTQLANVANEQLVPALSEVIQQTGPELAASLAESVPALVDFLETLIPMLPQLLQLGTEALPLFIGGVQLILPLLQTWTENTTGLATILNATFALLSGDSSVNKLAGDVLNAAGVVGVIMRAAQAAGLGFRGFLADVQATSVGVATSIADGIGQAVGFIGSLPSRASAALAGVGSVLISSGRALIGGFIAGIKQMIDDVGNAVSGVVSHALEFFPNSPAKRGPLSGTGWNNLAKSGEAYITQWTSGFARPDLTGALTPALSAAPATVRSDSAALSGAGGPMGYAGPSEIVVVDADGALVGRMQVEGTGAVRQFASTFRGGRR